MIIGNNRIADSGGSNFGDWGPTIGSPAVLAGNKRVWVRLPTIQGATHFELRASSGERTVVPTGQLWAAVSAANGTPVTVQIAAYYNSFRTRFSAPSRAVTPSAIADADFEVDPIVWFNPNSLALGNGASVATLPDLSGNGFDAVQATAGNRPTFVTGAINGRGVLNGAGGQWLTFPATQAITGSTFIDISVWAINNGAPSDNRFYSNQASTTDTGYVSVDGNGTASQSAPVARLLLPYMSPVTLPASASATFMLSLELTSKRPGRAYLNGALQANPTSICLPATDRRTWQIFGYGGNNKTINGRLAHFSRWPAAMTQRQRWAIEAYIAGLFGLTISQG